MLRSFVQVLKSLVGTVVGATPGFLCWWVLGYTVGWGIAIAVLGGFIALCLTLPSVSGTRVFGATAGVIVGYNTSDGWGESVYKSIVEDNSAKTALSPDAAVPGPHAESSTVPREPVRREPASSSNHTAAWWIAGFAGLGLTLLAAFSRIHEQRRHQNIASPPRVSDETLRDIAKSLERSLEAKRKKH